MANSPYRPNQTPPPFGAPDYHTSYRFDAIEKEIGKVEDQIVELEKESRTFSDFILRIQIEIDSQFNSLSNRLKPFENSLKTKRGILNKIIIGVGIAIAVIMFRKLLQISWVVQTSKINGGE